MILEVAILSIRPGMEAEYAAAVGKARPLIAASPGFISVELRQCLEQKNRFLLLVQWEKLEDHTEGFRKSARFEEWRAALHHFYDGPAVVQHYTPSAI
jgi:heme-degrading monooxygenase HmoA